MQLGRFELLEIIGRGGMAEVWRARHPLDPRPVAVKVMTRSGDPPTLAAFAHEVRAAASLSHPGVLAVVDHGVVPEAHRELAPGQPWLAMELADGGTLAPRLGKVGWEAARELLVALLQTLAHVHAKGIVHLDLKPANVLFGGWCEGPRLTDFGIAASLRALETRPFSDHIVGTPAWMAPEQFRAEQGPIGPWTDLYALGCVAWALLTGRSPYARASGPLGLGIAHLSWPLPRLDAAVPAEVESWLHRLLAKRPDERFERAADALHALVGREVVVAERPPVPPLGGVGLGVYGLREVPLVGREAERGELWAALEEVVATGRPGIAVLRGASGQGTSRLAAWLCERANAEGTASDLRAASPGELPLALGSLLTARTPEALRAWLVRTGGHDAREARALSPLLMPERASTPANGVVRRLLERAARLRPVVVWLDAPGSRLLELAEQLLAPDVGPVLVLLTVTTEELAEAPERADRVAALAARGREIALDPLTGTEMGALVEGLLGLTGELGREVARRSQGNPRFAVELVRDWVERGVLVPVASGFELAEGASAELPDDVGTIWRERVERWLAGRPADWGPALELAAVLEQPVSRAVWERACRAEALAPRGVEQALAADHLVVSGPGSWRFAQPMLSEALLARAGERARGHHLAAAGALGTGPGSAARRGRHLLAAGRASEAAGELLAGLKEAVDSGRPAAGEPLAVLLRRARPEGLRPDEALQVARLDLARGRVEQARSGAEALRRSGAEGAVAAEALAIAGWAAWRRGALDEALALADEAAANPDAGHRLAAQTGELRGGVLSDLGDLDGAEAAYRSAQGHYEALGEAIGPGLCDLGLGMVELCRDQTEEALVTIRRGYDRLVAADAGRHLGVACNMLGEAHRLRGDLEASAAWYREALARHRVTGSENGRRVARLNLAIVCSALGRHAEAEGLALVVIASMDAEGAGLLQGASWLLLVTCAAGRGQWELYGERATKAEALLANGFTHPDLLDLAERAARLATEAGRPDEARRAWRMTLEQARALGRPTEAYARLSS